MGHHTADPYVSALMPGGGRGGGGRGEGKEVSPAYVKERRVNPFRRVIAGG